MLFPQRIMWVTRAKVKIILIHVHSIRLEKVVTVSFKSDRKFFVGVIRILLKQLTTVDSDRFATWQNLTDG